MRAARAGSLQMMCCLLMVIQQPASQLPTVEVVQQPDLAVARQAFTVQPRIELRDPETSDVDYNPYKVKASNSMNSPPLLGDHFVRVNGSFQFTDLRFERPGSGYTIAFHLYTLGNQLISSTTITTTESFLVMPPLMALAGNEMPLGPITAGTVLTPTPSVRLADTDQKILNYGDNVVFVDITETSAQPRDYPTLIMTGQLSEFSCCRQANCAQLKVKMTIECDCAHPKAALCAVPDKGIVSFHNITVNKMGDHVLDYLHVEIMPDGEVVRYTYVDEASFTIVPGPAEKLEVVAQPGDVFMGNVTGDEPALLDPQPTCGWTDSQLNTIPIGSDNFMMAIPCIDRTDTRIDNLPPRLVNPTRFCECNDEACIKRLRYVKETMSWGAQMMGGNAMGQFDAVGMARFTDLSTRLARNDIRVVCRFAEISPERQDSVEAALDPLFAYELTDALSLSNTFTVYPGRLRRLASLMGPRNSSGVDCSRCPLGVHLLKKPLQASVQLLDAANNEIAECIPDSRFCDGAPNTMIIARLYDSSDSIVGDIPPGNLHGITIANAVKGKAHFTDIRVSASRHGYYLKFQAEMTNFQPQGVTSMSVIHVDSDQFSVVNGVPAIINLISKGTRESPLFATDAEIFIRQPVANVLDQGRNIVFSDCYNDCGGQLTEQCELISNDTPDTCAPIVIVDLVGADSAMLSGTRSAITKGGVVTFTDLAIDSGGDCYPPPPFPDYVLEMSLQGVNGLPVDVHVSLERRVLELQVVEQPALSVATESFSNEIVVRAVNCLGELVPLAPSTISIAIKDNKGSREPGVLSGTLSVPLIVGEAVFTDLSIQAEGNGYTLTIIWRGNALVSDTFTTSFEIQPAVQSLELLVAPTGTVRAGEVFVSQPQVVLKDFQNDVVLNSKAGITAGIADNPGKMQAWDFDQSILAGSRVVTAVDGRAIFTDLSLPKASVGQELDQEGYSLVFIFRSMRIVTNYFLVEPNQWAGLYIQPTTQPVTAIAGQKFPKDVRVLLVDAFKNKLLPTTVPEGTFVNVQLEEPLSRQGAARGVAPVLQKHNCNEQCDGKTPTQCSTCPDKRLEADSGAVIFTDFRIDIVGQGYRLTFSCASFSITSDAFDVQNAVPSYMRVATQPSAENRADQELFTQPDLSMHDAYGNFILMDSHPFHEVEVRISTRAGLARAAGFAEVPGQAPNSICRVSDTPLGGSRVINATDAWANFTNLAVRPAMSGFRLQFFATTSQGVLNVSSNEFSVGPGVTVGICNMTLPGRCSALSPCRDSASIACVDAYGNVQSTCSTCLGDRCNIRPYQGKGYELPVGMETSLPCFGKVCVSIIAPSIAILRQGPGGAAGVNCAEQACSAVIDMETGFATFTQLVLDVPSPLYTFKFSALIVDPLTRVIYEWVYVTPHIDNLPPAPILHLATFSQSFTSISLSFTKPTNMNNGSDTCGAVLDQQFVTSLGVNPSCKWMDPSSYLIVPGTGAYVNETTQVLLRNESNIVFTDVFAGFRMESLRASTTLGVLVEGIALKPVLVTLPAVLPTPTPIILGAQEISACDLVRADASLSEGSATRAFASIKWSVDYAETYLYEGLLTNSGSKLEFVKRHIHFSSLLPNVINTVTITLRPTAPVEANSTILISGIPQYFSRAGGCPATQFHTASRCLADTCRVLNLEGPSAFLFDQVVSESGSLSPHDQTSPAGAQPDQANGGGLRLRVSSSHYLSSSSDTVVRFTIQNPPLPWPSSPVSISSICKDCICSDRSCEMKSTQTFEKQRMKMQCSGSLCKEDATFELKNPSLSIRGTLSETTRIFGARNILTLNFSTSHDLPPGSGVVIKGLPPVHQLGEGLAPDIERDVANDGQMPGRQDRDGLVCVTGPSADFFECRSCPNHDGGAAAGIWRTGTSRHDMQTTTNLANLDMGRGGQIHLRVNAGKTLPAGYHQVSWRFYNPMSMLRQACRTVRESGNLVNVPALECKSTVQPTIHVSYEHGKAAADCQKSPSFCVPGVVLETPAQNGKAYGVLGAGDTPSWSRARVSESNRFSGFVSHLLIEVEANIEFSPLTHLTVSGFPRRDQTVWARSPQTVQVIDGIRASDGDLLACFGVSHVAWNADGTAISWQIRHSSPRESCFVPAGTLLRFAIPIVNSNMTTTLDDSALSIRAAHHGCARCVRDECECSDWPSKPAYRWVLPSTPLTRPQLIAPDGTITYKRLLSSSASLRLADAHILSSNSVAGQLSTLTVRFRPSYAIFSGSSMTLTGLRPSATPSSLNMPITATFVPYVAFDTLRNSSAISVELMGVFDATLGSLTFTLGRDVAAHALFSVSFVMKQVTDAADNASQSEPAAIRARIITPVCVHEENMDCDRTAMMRLFLSGPSAKGNESCSDHVCQPTQILEARQLLVGHALHGQESRALRTKAISETTRVPEALNIITVDLQANFEIHPGYRLTITGLAGNKMDPKSEPGLTAVETRTRLLPNCSCTSFEHVCDCSGGTEKLESVQFRVWQPDSYFADPALDSAGRPISAQIEGAFKQAIADEGNTLELTVAGSPPVCDPSCGSRGSIPAERPWRFSFVLRNPGAGPRTALRPQISLSDRSGAQLVAGDVMNGTVFANGDTAAFTAVSISEDSNVFSALTNITLTLSTNCPLGSLASEDGGGKITISGLKGFQNPSGYVKLRGNDAYMFGKAGVARWSLQEKTVVFEGVSLPGNCFPPSETCWLPERWTVSFWLAARSSTAAGQAFPTIEARDGNTANSRQFVFNKQAIGGVPLSKAFVEPLLDDARITQSSLVQGDTNNLTLSFTPSVALPSYANADHSSEVVLSGLVGTLTPDNDALPLYGDDAALFVGATGKPGTGVWRPQQGSLRLILASGTALAAGYKVHVSLLLLNPVQAQTAAKPTLRAMVRYPPQINHDPWRLESDRVSPMVNFAHLPLLESPVRGLGILSAVTRSMFITKSIQESSRVNRALNTLSLVLSANIDLPPGVTIILEGFQTTTNFKAGSMPLQGASAHLFQHGSTARTAQFQSKVDLQTSEKYILLTLTLASTVHAGEEIRLNFVLQNVDCAGACQPKERTITVSADGGTEHPNVMFPKQSMDNMLGGVTGAGGSLSWVEKNIWETTNVRGAPNTLIVTLQPNAPLYEGSQVVITGAVNLLRPGWADTCVACLDGKRAYGSGCSALCKNCPLPEPADTRADAYGSDCVVVLEDEYSNPHPLFENSLGIWQSDPETAGLGSLTLTVRRGFKISEAAPISLVLKLRNPMLPEERKECWRDGKAQCLQVSVSNGKLCTEESTLSLKSWSQAEECSLGEEGVKDAKVSIQASMDHFRNPQADTCAKCLRPADLVALDRVLRTQQRLILTGLAVEAPSIAGMPVMVSGGLVPGNYTIRLKLQNWLKKSAEGTLRFSKDLGTQGQTKSEDLKPTVYIQGPVSLSGAQVSSGRDMMLQALAHPASCQYFNVPSPPRQWLRYIWSAACIEGPCELLPPLEETVLSVNTRSLHLPIGGLMPGVAYRFQVEAQQDAIVKSTKARMLVRVPVRPLSVNIVGLSDQGVLGSGAGQQHPLDLDIIDPEWGKHFEDAFGHYHFSEDKSPDEHYAVSWGCALQVEVTQETCPDHIPRAMCPPALFVPCPSQTLHVAYRPCTTKDPLCDHAASLSHLSIGRTYRVEANVSRSARLLPFAIWDRIQPAPAAWVQMVRAVKTFRVVQGKPVSVAISVCELMKLGTAGMCQQPASTIVNPSDKLLLQAKGQSFPTSVGFKSFRWAVESAADASGPPLLRPDTIIADLIYSFSGVLVLKPGVLTPGRTTTIRVTAVDLVDDVAMARLDIRVRMPPVGGKIVVSPSLGVAMHTEFMLEALSWSTDEENFPLSFSFFCGEEGSDAASHLPLNSSVAAFSITSLLPTSPAPDRRLLVGVDVSDIFAASSRATTIVTVRSTSIQEPNLRLQPAAGASPGEQPLLALLETVLLSRVDTMFRLGDVQNAQGLVGLIAQTLNSEPPCPEPVASDCLAGTALSRQPFRARLLLTVREANQSMVPTPDALSKQAAVILKIVDRPAEINFETVEVATRLIQNNILAIRKQVASMDTETGTEKVGTSRIEVEPLARLNGIATVRLLQSLKLSQSLLSLPPPSRVAADADELSVRVPARQHHEYDVQGSAGAVGDVGARVARAAARMTSLRAHATTRAMTQSSLRKLRHRLMRDVFASVSSLSVSQVEAGSLPVVLRLPGCIVNTSRVRLDRLRLSGWRAEGSASDMVADLPPSLADEDMVGEAPTQLEIMHVFWDRAFEKTLQLPPSYGPVFFLQVRRPGSDEVIRFSQSTELLQGKILRQPWVLTLPVTCHRQSHQNETCPTASVPREANDKLGSRMIPFGSSFDYDQTRGFSDRNWFWNTEGFTLRTRPGVNNGHRMSVNVHTLARSLFSVWEVEEGCDGVPESRNYKDHCGVCKGDNSTCSGCDGKPNTGRDKDCSGHGTCKLIAGMEESRCACVTGWYDIMCSTYCNHDVKCSGHGMCFSTATGDPDDGKKCLCQQGWIHGDAPPFCAEPDPTFSALIPSSSGVNQTAIALQQKATERFILIIILPSIAGALIVCFGTYRILYRRKIQEAKWRETKIYYPQPQLECKAEERPDDLVAQPDENGWSNVELPAPSDSFAHGPASGQFASRRIADSRHRLGELAQDSMALRANNMRWQVREKNTVTRYLVGPDAVSDAGVAWDDDVREAEIESHAAAPVSGGSFLPAWLGQPASMRAAGPSVGEQGQGDDDVEIAI